MGFSSFFWNGRLNEQQERKRKKMLDEEFYFILFFFLLIFFFFSSCFIFVPHPFMAFLFSVFSVYFFNRAFFVLFDCEFGDLMLEKCQPCFFLGFFGFWFWKELERRGKNMCLFERKEGRMFKLDLEYYFS